MNLGYEDVAELISLIKKRPKINLADAEGQFNTRLAKMQVAVE